ncbi:uncharacterized protein A4U43_C04F9400 [Asparagus officinalis]|uniref:SRP54-type proteins GTP-binding domain-containing protein n=1 Tax=Asparagus officinalis TaxID=4686 RepID=A0A5P1F4D1_ASPOF|nr:signal recognition particle receptor subunit alpha-like [Asparagus officinalis]ONK71511.1 uncharacterized protein A4U43_C04F9400 [Asparagus officinalis]
MLEQLLILSRGGLILWYKQLSNALKGSPIETLIKSCLLEERSAETSFNYDAGGGGGAYTLKWTFHNDLGLVFVGREFEQIYDPKRTSYDEFDEIFRQLQKEAEARAEEMKKLKQSGKNPSNLGKKAWGTGSLMNKRKSGKSGNNDGKSRGDDGDGDGDESNGKWLANGKANGKENNGVKESRSLPNVVVKGKENGNPDEGAFDVHKLQKLRAKGGKKTDANTNTNKGVRGEEKKIVKKNRVWDDAKEEDAKLDFTDPVGEGGDEVRGVVAVDEGESMMDKEEILSSEDEDDEEMESAKPSAKKKGWFSSMFQSISGNSVLEKSNLKPALKALKDRLMTKNVAEEIAEKLCESVAASLEGKKLGSFTRVSSTVQTAMEEALLRILTPRRSIDILRDVHAAKEQGKPYVIVFVGVNGVGKSTNLAKVAYWLLQHNVSVMMAACDTFRSGAVEQLRTHARRLQIPIFEKGYEKDPAIVAKEAIQEASRNNSDVVLVDTAGRMQDNEPLMRALSKLINLNNPDLVLFVGEALVGNDAVDQLSKFNQKLADLSTLPNARLIDGILLTKFDTIDDKVGAALSMVYICGAPVMFVGCGQSYTDLKKLNVKFIVKTLLN